MKNLIEALQILLKYGNPEFPTHCDCETFTICGINPKDITVSDKQKLRKLGFRVEIRGTRYNDGSIRGSDEISSQKYGKSPDYLKS